MHERKLFSSGAKWENIVGYSRAVRVGNVIEISGTTSVDGETVMGENNIFEQTVFILKKIEQTLKEAGGSMEDVVRTRIFVTDISKWNEVAKAHEMFFKEIKPTTTMVEVHQLIDEKLLIEIEATAIVC